MTKKISEDDRRAIDVLMDRQMTNTLKSNGKPPFANMYSPTLWKRIQSIENILQLLAHLPASDPPHNLAGKTLQRVQQQETAALAAKSDSPTKAAMNSSRPNA
jgi:hypothetical protein